MGRWGWAMLAGALGLMGGCAPTAGPDGQSPRLTGPGGGKEFTLALAREYRELALFEADKTGDRIDAQRFAEKSRIAAQGKLALPESVDRLDEASPAAAELRSGRERLMTVFDKGARRDLPGLAALAQGRFDCWVERQAEAGEPDRAAPCRDQFHAALGRIEAALLTRGTVLAPAAGPGPGTFVVFFPLGGATLDQSARRVVEQAIATAQMLDGTGFTVYGYADRAGDQAVNLALSRRRAEAVRAELLRQGAAPEAVRVVASGEAEPALPTTDGVPEQANRRAEIAIR